jgi:hypothetical protein
MFVPSGYLSIHEALNLVGRDLFKSEWTNEENKARSGLISEDEWLKIKDLPPARGGGAPRSARGVRPGSKPGPHWTGDPSDPSYQKEYQARVRYLDARRRLRERLAADELEAAILDPWTGKLHRASPSLWRRADADRIIDNGQARIPGGRNIGSLLIKRFVGPNVPRKPLPKAKIREAIARLKEKTASETLTRPQQAEFLRESFSTYSLTTRQIEEIFRAVPTSTGRPKKSDKKV